MEVSMGYQSKVTSKGQTTIPQEVREYLKLKPGDRINYVLDNGLVRLIPKNRSIADLAGFLGKPPAGAGATLEDIDEAIGDYIAEDHERIRRQWNKGQE
jgi:AbrB family looped-hinge helix DNA binding protein